MWSRTNSTQHGCRNERPPLNATFQTSFYSSYREKNSRQYRAKGLPPRNISLHDREVMSDNVHRFAEFSAVSGTFQWYWNCKIRQSVRFQDTSLTILGVSMRRLLLLVLVISVTILLGCSKDQSDASADSNASQPAAAAAGANPAAKTAAAPKSNEPAVQTKTFQIPSG